jgi:hypothetical protein
MEEEKKTISKKYNNESCITRREIALGKLLFPLAKCLTDYIKEISLIDIAITSRIQIRFDKKSILLTTLSESLLHF